MLMTYHLINQFGIVIIEITTFNTSGSHSHLCLYTFLGLSNQFLSCELVQKDSVFFGCNEECFHQLL